MNPLIPNSSDDETAEEFFAEEDPRPADFRRANGAPMVRRLDGSGRWERYSRPSGFGHDLDDESALNNWRIDRAIEGVATTPSLAAAIAAAIGRKEGRKDRREQAMMIGRGEEAADLGTALHAMAHRLETEEGFRAPPPYDADLAAYLMALDAAGLESTHFEVQICSDRWRAAGTADRLYRARRQLFVPDGPQIEPGQYVIGDLKTGKTMEYSLPGYAIQLAIYADGDFYDVETDERSSLPTGFRTDWGLLVHLPVGQARCELLWCDLEIGRHGASLVKEVREWRKRDDFAIEFSMPESDEVAVLMSPIYDLENEARASVALDGDTYSLEGPEFDEWRDGMLEWARARVNVIGCHSDARAMLLRSWPTDVPPMRAEGHTAWDVSKILDLLDRIESAYGLPFCEGDPRLEWNAGLHRSEMQRGNLPQPQRAKDNEQ